MRLSFAAFLLVTGCALPAGAMDTVVCTDAADEVTFTYVIAAAAVQPIIGVELQLTGDYGLSTDPSHPDHDGEYVSRSFVGDGVEGGDVSWKDEAGDDHLAMSFRIGRVFEARQALVGGVVAVAAGGLWTVTCRSSDLGM